MVVNLTSLNAKQKMICVGFVNNSPMPKAVSCQQQRWLTSLQDAYEGLPDVECGAGRPFGGQAIERLSVSL